MWLMREVYGWRIEIGKCVGGRVEVGGKSITEEWNNSFSEFPGFLPESVLGMDNSI